MKTKTWILLFSVLAVLLLAGGLWLLRGAPTKTAEVWSDGALVRTVDLSQPQTFRVEYQGGYNVIQVEDGEIFVTEASCPDQICIAHGPAAGGAPIVCLPNRLVIQFTADDGGSDAMTG